MNHSLRLAILEPGSGGNAHRENHVPVDFCAFAVCTEGTCHGKPRAIPADTATVLLVLDEIRLGRCLRALRQLKRAGKTVLIAFADAGGMQIADLMDRPRKLERFFELCRHADAAVATRW